MLDQPPSIHNCPSCGQPLSADQLQAGGPRPGEVCPRCELNHNRRPGAQPGELREQDPPPLWDSARSSSQQRAGDPFLVAAYAQGGQPSAPPADPDRPPWGPVVGIAIWIFSVAMIFIAQAVAIVVWYILDTIRGLPMPQDAQGIAQWALTPRLLLVQIVSTVVAHIVTLAACWAVVTRGGRRPFWQSLGWRWPALPDTPQIISAFYKCGFVLGIVAAMILLNAILVRFIPQSQNTPFDQILKISPQIRIAVALMAVLTAPLLEEIVYRGVLYSALTSRLGVIAAVLIVSLLFASVHVVQYLGAWASLTGLTVLSFVLTIVRARTKSLAPCVAIHTVFNLAGALLILVKGGES